MTEPHRCGFIPSMQCKTVNPKTQPPSLLEGLVDQKLQKLNVQPLVETAFSEADRKIFWKKVKIGKPNECWEWQGARNKNGYGEFYPEFRNRVGSCLAHRCALVISGTPLNGKYFALHSCDNPPCCNPAHLRLGTPLTNRQDAVLRDRIRNTFAYGERHGRHKLTTSQVMEIRVSKLKNSELSKIYKVTQATISRIISGARWAHIPLPDNGD